MMDNHLYYGEYEIIGHLALSESEFEFPISYGHRLEVSQMFFFSGA